MTTAFESHADLAALWTRLRRSDVFPVDVRTALQGLLGRNSAVASPDRLLRLVDSYGRIVTLKEATMPVHLVTADLLSGQNRPAGSTRMDAAVAG